MDYILVERTYPPLEVGTPVWAILRCGHEKHSHYVPAVVYGHHDGKSPLVTIQAIGGDESLMSAPRANIIRNNARLAA